MTGLDGSDFEGEYDSSFLGSTDDGIRQGDVLQLIASADVPVWERHFGVIVTANCDIAFGKNYGIFTYVPIVPVEIYVHRIVLPRHLAAEIRQERTRLTELVEETLSSRVLEMIDLQEYSLAEIQSSVEREVPSANANTCIARLVALSTARQELAEVDGTEGAFGVIRRLAVSLDEASTGKQVSSLIKLKKAIHQGLTRQIPGDVMFFSRVAPGDDRGYVAVLRLIREVVEDAIALSPVLERKTPTTFRARRVSRLRLLYTHRLVQQMGQVFTDIGLPVAYEKSREHTSDLRLSQMLEPLTGD